MNENEQAKFFASMNEEQRKRIEVIHHLTHSDGWEFISNKALSHREALYANALKETDPTLSKQLLEQIKGIEYVLGIPNKELNQISFELNQAQQLGEQHG